MPAPARRRHEIRGPVIAELMAKLERVPAGDGTLLENTAIVYLSDNAAVRLCEAHSAVPVARSARNQRASWASSATGIPGANSSPEIASLSPR